MPDNRKKYAALQKEVKSLRLRIAELQKNKLKKQSETLQKSDLLYQMLMENINLGITLIDANYKIVTTNVGHGLILRKPHNELIGKYCFREFEKRSAVCSHCPGTRAMATRRPAEVETTGVRDDGSHVPARVQAFPAFETDGTIKGFLEVVEDLTERRQTEEKLKESEQRFKVIFDNARDGILLTDVESKKFYLGNKAICTMLGYTPEEIKNKTVSDIHLKEHLSFVLEQFEKLAREEIAVDDEVPVKRKDGSLLYADISAFPITLGGKTYLTGIFRDVTERKRVEEELREGEIKIRAIFDQTFQFIGLMNINGTLIEANRTALEFSGIESSSVLNKPFWQGPWWTHSPELQEKLRQSVEKAARGEFIRFEATHVAKDGMLRYIDFSIKPVKDETGKVIFLIPEGRDITEHRQAEENLKESEQRFRAMFDNARDGILLTDMESKKFYLGNKAICTMLDYTPEEIKNKTVSDIHLKEHLSFVLEQFEKLAREEIAMAEDIPVKRRDGSVFYADIGAFKITFGGKTYLTGIFRDVTERKKIEEELNIYREKMAQAERLASLGTLSATIAHELNQPLTVIRLSIENSLDDLEPTSCCKTVKDVLKDALNEVTNATSVVDRFRNYARQSSRKNLCETNLGAIAGRIIQLLGKTAQRARMTLHLKGMDKLPPVYSNEKDLEQLFFALTENAIQAAGGKESRRLTIEGVIKDKNVELRFRDNCSGIAPENLDRIFDPFFTTRSDGGGTGLGLPIVQRIVSGYGGKIRVQSRPGKGTTFYVTLPIHSETVE